MVTGWGTLLIYGHREILRVPLFDWSKIDAGAVFSHTHEHSNHECTHKCTHVCIARLQHQAVPLWTSCLHHQSAHHNPSSLLRCRLFQAHPLIPMPALETKVCTYTKIDPCGHGHDIQMITHLHPNTNRHMQSLRVFNKMYMQMQPKYFTISKPHKNLRPEINTLSIVCCKHETS